MRTTDAAPATIPEDRTPARSRRRRAFDIAIVVAFGLLLVGLAWPFLSDTARLAVTKDPAWYTWRGKLILDADTGSRRPCSEPCSTGSRASHPSGSRS
jgi:hypothetical protein